MLKLGAYTACLHDKTLAEALDLVVEAGLSSVEVNAGGFIPTPHLPVDAVLSSDSARDEYLDEFARRGLTLTGLNVNGNALHPDPEVGPKHAADLRRSIGLAARLGVKRIVAMSGLPAPHEGGRLPAWAVIPWDSAYSEALAYQWDDVAIPFWTGIDRLAADADVKVAIEMHPHNLVFNPPTLERLVERTRATHVGAEMDPSHLFWQGIDPIAAIERLGGLVYHAAAKDTRINEASCRTQGVLDDRFRAVPAGEPTVGLGGRYVCNLWPEPASWQFAAVGRGHHTEYWSRFLRALAAVDPDMAVNIEHEDTELPGVVGLVENARALREAAALAGV